MTGLRNMRWRSAIARWMRERRPRSACRSKVSTQLSSAARAHAVMQGSQNEIRQHGPEAGRYCVLSTAHISATSAAILDLWAGPLSGEAPMTVASTVHGWFVSATPVPASQSEQLPADLRHILDFGRAHGFDFVMLDCDADAIDALTTFSW